MIRSVNHGVAIQAAAVHKPSGIRPAGNGLMAALQVAALAEECSALDE